jgi:superkiller protein 3
VDEAIAQFQKALDLQPDFAAAHNGLGSALLERGAVDEATAQFQKALELQPNDADTCYNLGVALVQKGQRDEGIAHYKRALELQPNHAMAHHNLGNALLQKGEVREALAHYQRSLEIQPDNPAAQNVLAWVLATYPEASIRNGARAVELAQRANQLSGGQDPMVLRSLGAAYAEGGRYAEAITTARQALSLATAQNNNALANELGAQIGLYQSGSPYRDPRLASPAR